MAMGYTRTPAEFVKDLKRLQPTLLCLEIYKGARESHKFKCKICKNIWSLNADAVLNRYINKTACKFCRAKERGYKQRPKMTHLEFMKIFKSNGLHLKYKPLEKYKGSRSPIRMKCLTCKNIFYPHASNIMLGKSGCGKCNTIVPIIYSGGNIIARFKNLPHIVFKEIPTYMNVPCKLHCKNCGNNWISKPQNLIGAVYGCLVCSQLATGYKRTNIKFAGKTYQLQGYEPLALPIIKNKFGNNIKHGKEVPRFYYKHRRYYPDFYLPEHNTIVEVKSNYTLMGQKSWYKNLLQKRKSVIKAGYKFKLLVFDNKPARLKLPKKWYELSYSKLKPRLFRSHRT